MQNEGIFDNLQNLERLEIFALSGCKEKLDWGEGRKLVALYDKKGIIFINQCDAF